MNHDRFEDLLQQELSQEVAPSHELDIATRQRMIEHAQKKETRFAIQTCIVCFALILLELCILAPFLPTLLIKIFIIGGSIGLFFLFISCATIFFNPSTNLK